MTCIRPQQWPICHSRFTCLQWLSRLCGGKCSCRHNSSTRNEQHESFSDYKPKVRTVREVWAANGLPALLFPFPGFLLHQRRQCQYHDVDRIPSSQWWSRSVRTIRRRRNCFRHLGSENARQSNGNLSAGASLWTRPRTRDRRRPDASSWLAKHALVPHDLWRCDAGPYFYMLTRDDSKA